MNTSQMNLFILENQLAAREWVQHIDLDSVMFF